MITVIGRFRDRVQNGNVGYNVSYPKAWSGLGQADPVWRMFGTLPDENFAIPLYVLVDPENRVALATRGVNDVR